MTTPRHEALVVLPVLLHARPAALVAREVAAHQASVTIDGVDAASVLELMRLGAVPGQTVRVVASGPAAAQALDAVVRLVGTGLGPAPTAGRHGLV